MSTLARDLNITGRYIGWWLQEASTCKNEPATPT